MTAAHLPPPVVVLALVGVVAIVSDLVVTPHLPSLWNELGIGLLAFALAATNHHLSQHRGS